MEASLDRLRARVASGDAYGGLQNITALFQRRVHAGLKGVDDALQLMNNFVIAATILASPLQSAAFAEATAEAVPATTSEAMLSSISATMALATSAIKMIASIPTDETLTEVFFLCGAPFVDALAHAVDNHHLARVTNLSPALTKLEFLRASRDWCLPYCDTRQKARLHAITARTAAVVTTRALELMSDKLRTTVAPSATVANETLMSAIHQYTLAITLFSLAEIDEEDVSTMANLDLGGSTEPWQRIMLGGSNEPWQRIMRGEAPYESCDCLEPFSIVLTREFAVWMHSITKECFSVEEDVPFAIAVLSLAAKQDLRAANVFSDHFATLEKTAAGDRELPAPSPLRNFIRMLLTTLEYDAGPLFSALREKYALAVGKHARLGELLNEIGKEYFAIVPAENGMSGLMKNMMQMFAAKKG